MLRMEQRGSFGFCDSKMYQNYVPHWQTYGHYKETAQGLLGTRDTSNILQSNRIVMELREEAMPPVSPDFAAADKVEFALKLNAST